MSENKKCWLLLAGVFLPLLLMLLFLRDSTQFYFTSGYKELKPYVVDVKKKDAGGSSGFEISFKSQDYDKVKGYLSGLDSMEEFKRGGIHYGDINVGSEISEDVQYSSRPMGSGSETVAISRKKSMMWYIKNGR